jgi:glycosyltransferase involved in cell wall biosynthesis
MKKIKKPGVTFLINSLSAGGSERVVHLLSSRLCDEGGGVRIICLEKDIFYNLPKEVDLLYLKTNRPYFILSLKFIELFYFAVKLRRIIRKKKINIIQSHLFRANYVNILAKILGGGHKAQVVNTVAVGSKYNNKTVKGALNLFLIKTLYPHMDRVIFKSKAMACDFKKHFPFNFKHTIINNPCNLKMIKQLSKKRDNNLSLKVNSDTIIAVGRFEKHKHYELLVEVFNSLLKDFPKLNLLVFGDGPERKKIHRLVKEFNITEKVKLPGKIKNPFYFMARAGLYVSCSESEGFPNALIEAMACSLPVVSSDCLSGPREILAPETDPMKRLETGFECAKYGVLFAVNDKKALTQAISELLNNHDLYVQYKKKSKQRAFNYNVNTIIEQYKAVLGLADY